MSRLQKERQNNGKNFEKLILGILQDNEFFATKLLTGATGTPFDILAIKNRVGFAIECKHYNKMPKNINISCLRDNQKMGLDYFNYMTDFDGYVVFGNLQDKENIRAVRFSELYKDKKIEANKTIAFDSLLRSV